MPIRDKLNFRILQKKKIVQHPQNKYFKKYYCYFNFYKIIYNRMAADYKEASNLNSRKAQLKLQQTSTSLHLYRCWRRPCSAFYINNKNLETKNKIRHKLCSYGVPIFTAKQKLTREHINEASVERRSKEKNSSRYIFVAVSKTAPLSCR